MTDKIIGRKRELTALNRLRAFPEAEFLALYGRRRVGKTYLIRNSFADADLYFEITGEKDSALGEQLENFADAFGDAFLGGRRLARPRTWRDAFSLLASQIETLPAGGKKVIFLDELPWLASRRSGFLSALDYFWNHWASRRDDVLLIVCGSAASWMIKKVIRHKGGLHNRITERMRLLPFTLSETEAYLASRGIRLDRLQIAELYMAVGGVPHYLRHVRRGLSAAQNIDRMCFGKDGMLVDEFPQLFASLFEHEACHVAVVRALARNHRGMTRDDILEAAGLSSGGGATDVLSGLEESGFIGSYIPFGKTKRETLYYLTDEYSLFFLTWIDTAPRNVVTAPSSGYWHHKSRSRSWSSWSGYAFERLCQKHSRQIENALGISGISTVTSSWQYRPQTRREKGAQIDLVIDRADRVVTLCEIKFCDRPFVITKDYAARIQEKIDTFRRITRCRKTLLLAMITPFGLESNDYAGQLVHQEATLDDLYAEVRPG